MEKQKAAIKFKAAARCARITHDLTNIVRNGDTIHRPANESDEEHN